MLQLVVLMLVPVPRLPPIQSACTALNCLPSPFFPPSSLLSSLLPLSPCLHRPVTQSCVQHSGNPAAALPLLICQMSSSSRWPASFSTVFSSAQGFSFTIGVAASCITDVEKMRAPEPQKSLQMGFFSSRLPPLWTWLFHGTSLLETKGEKEQWWTRWMHVK